MELKKLIKTFPVLPIDIETATEVAAYRRKFLKIKRIQRLDYFMAAQAKLNNLTLITNNKADFPMKDIKVITPTKR